MANNQITPNFLNFANNVSLSQNKWNDTRLHQNKGCYYNNLLSPFWKRKESFKGMPFTNGNDVYSIENGALLKNGNIMIQEIPDGYSYDLLAYEVLAAFQNGNNKYRFYKTSDKIQLDYNDEVIDLNIDYYSIAKAKVIQIPTKTGYQASFGMLVITKSNIFEYKWYNIHYNSAEDVLIESSDTVSSNTNRYSEYVIIGGLVKDGNYAGFTVFYEEGWHMHDMEPPEVIIDINNLTVKPISLGNLTVINETPAEDYNQYTYVADAFWNTPGAGAGAWSTYNFSNYNAVVRNPHTYFYFSKYEKSGITINGTNYPVYGFEMWISSKSQLSKSSLQMGNNITDVTFNNNNVQITITSRKVFFPYYDYRLNKEGFNWYVACGFMGAGETNPLWDNIPFDWSSAITFNFASSSLIHEDFQENVYCGYHKVNSYTVPYGYAQTFILGADGKYFNFAYTEGKVCENGININSAKTFNNLNPGDKVVDPAPTMYKINEKYFIAFNGEGGIDNLVTKYGNALMQWQNIDSLKFGENDVVYGRFMNNNQWFRIKRCAPYIVAKFNDYLLINCDGLNAYNFDKMELTDCWSPGYNGSLSRSFTVPATTATELNTPATLSMPVIKRTAAVVNCHPEIQNNYFCGTKYTTVIAYNYNDYTVGGLSNDNNDNFITFIYPIELYRENAVNPIYVNSREKESASTYTDANLVGQTYQFSNVEYAYFLCNFSYEFYFNRFGIINLGNNMIANVIYYNEVYQVTLYSLSSLIEDVQYIFVVMGQIYFIRKNYIYAVILNQNFTISYSNPLTECNNLIFCGNTSKYAFFFSPLTRAFYRFTGSQIFEYMQDASDVQSVVKFKNNYYMNISLISYIDSNSRNKVLMIQNDFSVIAFEDTDDLQDIEEGNVTDIVIDQRKIYFVTSSQNVYSLMFYDSQENYTKIRLEYESETLLNDFSQNNIDCIYVNAYKKSSTGKIIVSLISGDSETKQEFNLREIREDDIGLSLIRYQPRFQQRGRVAIRVESDVPLENIAYTVKPIGNEISKKRIEI